MSSSSIVNNDYLLGKAKWNNMMELHTTLEVTYPGGKDFAVLFTHDVDEVSWSWRRRALMTVRHPLTVLRSKKNPYMSFDQILTWEEELGITSTFFFMSKRRRPEDAHYDLSDLEEVLEMITSAGREIGLHATIDSFDNKDYFIEEKTRLQSVIGREVKGVRQHFLRFSYPETWAAQEKAGFLYDSSVYNLSKEGFSVGYCYPYRPPGYKIYEVPLTIMDCTLFARRYNGYSIDQAKESCLKLLKIIQESNGVLVLNWHNTQWDDLSFPKSAEFYEWLTGKILNKDPYVDTMENFVGWWHNNVVP